MPLTVRIGTTKGYWV